MLSTPKTKKLSLALQGGGAHGAYTWGVLDRLLEDEHIVIDAISGTSAGAINAAVLVNGFAKNKYKGARKALEELWQAISDISLISPLQQTLLDRWVNGWNLDSSPAYTLWDLWSRLASPYDLNPLDINPLRAVLETQLDVKLLNEHKGIKLFATATSVRTGRARVFHCDEITVDVLLASACLPTMFQAVRVEDEIYWDGGYSGNPAIWPLIYHADAHDIMLVQINPFVRDEEPKHASEIINRMNEIGFNSSLIGELRAINFVSKLIHKNKLDESEYKDLRMHLIYSPKELHDLNASSKMNANWDFFVYLRDIGRTAADAWLKHNYDSLGKRSTLDFDAIFELHKKPAENTGTEKKPAHKQQDNTFHPALESKKKKKA